MSAHLDHRGMKPAIAHLSRLGADISCIESSSLSTPSLSFHVSLEWGHATKDTPPIIVIGKMNL